MLDVHAECVLVEDKYPKARRHVLVIARDPQLDGPRDLRRAHLPLLQRMQVCPCPVLCVSYTCEQLMLYPLHSGGGRGLD